MTGVSDASEQRPSAQGRAESVQVYAKVAGVLFLLTMLASSFGEMYVPSKIVVSTDAAMTDRNLESSDLLFRLGFATYLVEGLCDVALGWIFYVLLRPVHKDLALLAAFFGLVSTALFGSRSCSTSHPRSCGGVLTISSPFRPINETLWRCSH